MLPQLVAKPVAISDERVKEFLLILPFRIVIVLKNRRVVAKAGRFSRSPCSSFTLSFYTWRILGFMSTLRKDEDSYDEDVRTILKGY